MDNLITAANDAENMSVSFVTRIKSFEDQVTERETQALDNAARYGKLSGEVDPAVRQVVRQATADRAKREGRAYRRDLAEGTEAERTKRLKELLAIEAKANQLAPLSSVNHISFQRQLFVPLLSGSDPGFLSGRARFFLSPSLV